MAKVIYTAQAHVPGGRADGHGESSDGNLAADLVRDGHRVCPYSNATRGNIDVALTANGQPVADAS